MLVRWRALRQLGFGHLGGGELPELELDGMQSCFAIWHQPFLPMYKDLIGSWHSLELIVYYVGVEMTRVISINTC